MNALNPAERPDPAASSNPGASADSTWADYPPAPAQAPRPVSLRLETDGRLRIEYHNGQVRLYQIRELREACPCATCREQRGAPPPSPLQLTVLTPRETAPLTIQGMKPVGNYAYGIDFSDGHDTGIFTFELLAALGEAAQ